MWAALVVATLLSGRFAIVATAGEAAGQTPLRYVDADADRVSSVLEDLGNVEAGHVLRVRGATPASLRAARDCGLKWPIELFRAAIARP